MSLEVPIQGKCQSVELCNIYNYWQIRLYWLFRYWEKENKWINTWLHLETKHDGMDYDNLFGIGIPDILLNMLSYHGFLNNNESIVILKFPNRMSEYYFNKGFIELACDEDHLNKLHLLVKKIVGA